MRRSAKQSPGASAPLSRGESESLHRDAARQIRPRHLVYACYFVLFAWCCCPCFKLECNTKELEKRSCFIKVGPGRLCVLRPRLVDPCAQAMQRRRRLAVKRARALREGVPFNEGLSGDDDDDELEP